MSTSPTLRCDLRVAEERQARGLLAAPLPTISVQQYPTRDFQDGPGPAAQPGASRQIVPAKPRVERGTRFRAGEQREGEGRVATPLHFRAPALR